MWQWTLHTWETSWQRSAGSNGKSTWLARCSQIVPVPTWKMWRKLWKMVPTNPFYSNTRTSRSALHCGRIIVSSKRYPTSIFQIVCAEGYGVLWKKRGEDGRREHHCTEVLFPKQNKDYSETFHLIDKGNGAEANYNIGGHSKGHNWSPKLAMRFFNMNIKSAYKIYKLLTQLHTPHHRKTKMPECVKELMHSLLQRGPKVCMQAAKHPKHSRDLEKFFDCGTGWGIRSDSAEEVDKPASEKHRITKRLLFLKTQQKKAPWLRHQVFANGNRGIFWWSQCPGQERDRG